MLRPRVNDRTTTLADAVRTTFPSPETQAKPAPTGDNHPGTAPNASRWSPSTETHADANPRCSSAPARRAAQRRRPLATTRPAQARNPSRPAPSPKSVTNEPPGPRRTSASSRVQTRGPRPSTRSLAPATPVWPCPRACVCLITVCLPAAVAWCMSLCVICTDHQCTSIFGILPINVWILILFLPRQTRFWGSESAACIPGPNMSVRTPADLRKNDCGPVRTKLAEHGPHGKRVLDDCRPVQVKSAGSHLRKTPHAR